MNKGVETTIDKFKVRNLWREREYVDKPGEDKREMRGRQTDM
jgi:hypothetical protein